MKRSWIGFALLLVLLAVGLLASWVMADVHLPIAEKLELAGTQALEENWTGAAWSAAQARGSWEKWRFLRSSLTDHGPSEELNALFSMLEVYGAERERIAFAALCREMAQKIQAIGEAHGLQWENLL